MSVAGTSSATLGDPVRVEIFAESAALAAVAPVDLQMVPGIGLPLGDGSGGGASTISASLIVKDEEDNIERCLAALTPVVDEVVVYDTGSSDRTVELAEKAGATVIRGFWDDDFGAARNRALEHCTQEWILPVDADEVVQCDPQALRRYLSRVRGDLVRVDLVNVSWDGADDGEEYVVERVFRRLAGAWHGAVHERIVARRNHRSLKAAASPAPLRLVHLGYTADRMQKKGKGERNLAIAQVQIERGGADAMAWCDYGRSLALAGRPAEALAALDNMIGKPGPSSTFVLAGRTALECMYGLSHTEEQGEAWLQALSQHGEAPGRIALERARFALRQERVARAAELLTSLSTAPDCWGVPFDPDDAVGIRAEVLYRQGRTLESFELLLSVVDRKLEAVPLMILLLAAMRADVSFEDLSRRVPEQFISRSLRDVLHLDAANADAWLDALWSVHADPRALVAADVVCRALSINRVLVWQMRCLESGVGVSPLRSIATDEAASVGSRCLALAVLGDVLGDQDSRAEAVRLVEGVPADERDGLTATLQELAPGVLADALGAVASPATTTA